MHIIKTQNLEQLIAKCCKGNGAAQKQLYELFAPKMFALCLRYTNNKQDAQDVFQESFVQVFEKIGQLKNSELLEFWMKRIFINKSLRFLEQKKRLYFEEITDYNHPVINHNFSPCEYNDLLCVVNSLPAGYRTVFNLSVIDGYNHKEIAQQLNITESTSRSQLNRAKALLRDKIMQLESNNSSNEFHG